MARTTAQQLKANGKEAKAKVQKSLSDPVQAYLLLYNLGA